MPDSTTAEIVRARAGRDPRVRLLEAQGATEALHGGLEAATAPLIAIVDADAFLLPFALRRAVGRLMAAPASTFAVTGGLLVRNPRSRAVAWLLRWDRVTPGGFLVCERDVLRAAGGQLQGSGTFEPTALGLADNPVSFRTFRSGTGPFFRYLDGVFGCTFLPGALLALTGRFALVGPVTLAVLPLAALAAGAMFAHRRSAFAEVGLRTGRSIFGFGAYIALYPFALAPVSFAGYLKGLAEARRAR